MTGQTASDAMAVARDALQIAQQAKSDGSAHEKVCAERYGRIDDGLSGVKDDLISVTGSVKSISDRINYMLLGVMGALFAVVMALIFKT